jgi:hypothetical protein
MSVSLIESIERGKNSEIIVAVTWQTVLQNKERPGHGASMPPAKMQILWY